MGGLRRIGVAALVMAGAIGMAIQPASASAGPPGTVDTAFGQGGAVIADLGPAQDQATAMAVRSDGTILVAGFSQVDTSTFLTQAVVLALKPDGSPDFAFGSGGVETLPFLSNVTAIAVRPDDRIVIGGSDQAGIAKVVGLSADGRTTDPTFGTAGVAVLPAGFPSSTLALAPNGSVLVGGSAADAPGSSTGSVSIGRLTRNGVVDLSFGTRGMTTTKLAGDVSGAVSLVAQRGGSVAVAAYDLEFGSDGHGGTSPVGERAAVLRYRSNGTLDPSFGTGGITETPSVPEFYAEPSSLVADGAGNLIMGGTYSGGPTPFDLSAWRFTPAGTPDAAFGPGGRFSSGIVSIQGGYVTVTPDNAVNLMGTNGFLGSSSCLGGERILSSGAEDLSFGTSGQAQGICTQGVRPFASARAPDGGILLAGARSTDGSTSTEAILVGRFFG